jgi:hypothetical protein
MATANGFSIYETADGAWKVVAVLKNGSEASYDPRRFANEATATLYAIDCHRAKPSINYEVRRIAA